MTAIGTRQKLTLAQLPRFPGGKLNHTFTRTPASGDYRTGGEKAGKAVTALAILPSPPGESNFPIARTNKA
jgi:hypothetical protein